MAAAKKPADEPDTQGIATEPEATSTDERHDDGGAAQVEERIKALNAKGYIGEVDSASTVAGGSPTFSQASQNV
ncbi:MAG: hypothetical protein AAGC46_14435 [Solirubrobacteraceae bacterium]|nr:hypothetical protein [Patulibacter sp.]